MNKRNRIFLVLMLVFALFASSVQGAELQIVVNDVPLVSDVAPIVHKNRVMLPLRACAEALQANVDYDQMSGLIIVSRGNTVIRLTLSQNTAFVNDLPKQMDVPPLVIENRTLVPLRFLGETLDCQVDWQPVNGAVYIRSNDNGSIVAPEEDVEVPDAELIGREVLQRINAVRLQKDLESFISVTDLNNLALKHSRDMGENGFFSTFSPQYGSIVNRTAAVGLPATSELIAKLDYTTEKSGAAVTAWLNNQDARAVLLDPSAAYVGIGVFYLPGTTEVFVTVEVIPSRAYFIGLPSEYNTTNGELAVSGCSTAPQETVTVYKISPQNPNMYTEQQAYKVVVANSRFYTKITLPEKGEYLITVANCSCHISYN